MSEPLLLDRPVDTPLSPGLRPSAITSAFDRLLTRLVANERATVALTEALAPPLTFDEIFGFYRDSGFLYAAKQAALSDRSEEVEDTWRRLLTGDRSVFRFVSRYGLQDGRVNVRNAICAFLYTPRTWQAQHLVSLQRREYTGTLTLLVALTEWLHDNGAAFVRLSFRPNNPGTNRLFGGLAERLAPVHVSRSLVDYGFCDVRELDFPAGCRSSVTVRALAPDEGDLARAFYKRILDPVDFASLDISRPSLEDLDAVYALHGLTRRRTVLVAMDGEDTVGACLVNHGSEGINFSFLENAIEHLRVAPELAPPARRTVWLALARAAVAEVAHTRPYVVVSLRPEDRDLAVRTKLVRPDPKQYLMLTISLHDQAVRDAIAWFTRYYEALLWSDARTREVR